MTLNEYLAAEGLSTEEIAAIVGNEKQAKAMTKALGLADEGRALKAQSAAEKQETAQFWEQKTKELEGSVQKLTAAERRAAQAEADAARVKAYNKSLADQGYDIPKEMYEGAPAKPAEPGRSRAEPRKRSVPQSRRLREGQPQDRRRSGFTHQALQRVPVPLRQALPERG